MIPIYKTDNVKIGEEETIIYGELRGLSTDTKPTEIDIATNKGWTVS